MQALVYEYNELKTRVIAALEATNTHGFSHLQHYIIFFSHPLFSFTDSIVLLCQEGKCNAALVLLRSLYEAHINIVFHQATDTERRLALSAKQLQDGNRRILIELLELIRRYPNLRSSNPSDTFNETYLEAQIQKVNRKLQEIMRANNLNENDQPLNVKEKAAECDKASIKNAVPGSFQRMYSLIYRQLSPATHLDIAGLQYFVARTDDNNLVFTDGDGGDHITSQAIDICVAYIKDLYDLKILHGELPADVSTIENRLKELPVSSKKS